jgi:hypothetical protein
MKSNFILTIGALIFCIITLVMQCSSSNANEKQYCYTLQKDGCAVNRVPREVKPKQILPPELKGWQFYNCSIWKSNKGMRIHLSGTHPERWLKYPENPAYHLLRLLK